jgi:hypothetical protein
MRWHTSWNERLRGFEARALIASTALRTDSVSHGTACTGSVAWDVDGFDASGAGASQQLQEGRVNASRCPSMTFFIQPVECRMLNPFATESKKTTSS